MLANLDTLKCCVGGLPTPDSEETMTNVTLHVAIRSVTSNAQEKKITNHK